MTKIGSKLEAVGAVHAPEQRFIESDEIDGRYVTLKDPPGVYFILGTDNRDRFVSGSDWTRDSVQLIFLHTPMENVGRYAAAIGYRTREIKILPTVPLSGSVPSVILEPLQ